MKRRGLCFVLALVIVLTLMVGCASKEKEEETVKEEVEEIEEEKEESNDIPTLSIGYIFSNHQAPLIVAAAMNEEFKDEGVYLKEVVGGEEYVLMSGDDEIANIDLVAVDDGEEIMAMMTQGDLQMGLSSIDLPLTVIDDGHKIKILGPINVDGIGLVMSEDSPINNADDFIEYVKIQDKPVIIGYPSPDNVSAILFETVMKEMNIMATEDPDDINSDILLLDLKGTANLIPSLTNEQVDGWIGLSPFPELAEVEKAGKVVLDMRDLPPSGKWHEFPCCVFSATDDAIEDYPEEMEQLFKLLVIASEYANENKEDAGKLVADWTGMSKDAARSTTTIYTIEASQKWFDNVDIILKHLQKSGKLEGELKGRALKDIKNKIFYLDFAKNLQ
ncbi:MAG: ABC transporter substrate-binding protein [Tissierellia bacterium]|nr:ABC transporter substrate-binding protein [Tissierellia bacterium]